MSYIVYGAGGHAKVVIDILRARSEKIVGILDDHILVDEWNGLPVFGGTDRLQDIMKQFPESLFIVAIGDNEVRKRISDTLVNAGGQFGNAVHPSAVIAPNVNLGKGTVIMPMAVINSDAVIGEHVIINTSATVDHDCRISDFTHISPGVNIAGAVNIEASVHIGIGAALIQGVTVGRNTVVGAGACVINDLPENVVAVGCPANVINYVRDETTC
ncbi:sugar O-acyltransferase, sialic acid O-acetyltransferase NeuD family [Paenibacillus uliginis N3/975]|uniref:Sugar O-acyltransferase, sialic acid O-acetyltransferase NeuD family n=1 Tax=Paenibacillus uliginis N3/975 TaxID=1313296 RepID=A0A1X7GCD5_9BACL|nr:acetyltransferase [Paenibacillus uliginis]SMF67526.1 sugar O-acyltransferase, sialic acid O-acetyltransferase NeuD family [Paenibacillus uliginis N3/975]